jgi:metallo-beta-lactamase family protein
LRLSFFGAAGEVTGSCLLVETASARFLIDCGMFQGYQRGPASAPTKNRAAYQRDFGRIDFVLLTHAHLDHCGLLPRFAGDGDHGHGPLIYCTRPTADLLPVMLKDSAYVQARNTGGRPDRKHRPVATDAPLYSAADIDRLTRRVIGLPYDVEFRPHPSVTVRFRSAGHIVGAAFVEVRVRSQGAERLLVVSGDLGEASPLILRDRAAVSAADVLVIESTYGDRNHRPLAETENELIEVVSDVLHKRHGNVIVPAFALGRTQEFLVLLYRLALQARLRVPLVFVDSPLARQASAVTFAHLEALDDTAAQFHARYTRSGTSGGLPFVLRYTESVEDSMFLNSIHSGAVIVAASGMCEAGRIRHHLQHNLARRESAVLFTGFQAEGTLGRKIVDGAKSVRLFGETVPVLASVHTLGGLSAHAGQDSLLSWMRTIERRPKACFVVHGEPEAAQALSARITRDLKWAPTVAAPGTVYDV